VAIERPALHWRGPRRVGARYKLRKKWSVRNSHRHFGGLTFSQPATGTPITPQLVASTYGLPLRIMRQPFSFKPQSDHGTASRRSADMAVTMRMAAVFDGASLIQERVRGRSAAPDIQLSFLLFRVNRVPVILISFRNRFLAFAPTIT